jgi:hypothetical protein
MRREKERMGER